VHIILWEFRVKEGRVEEFECAHGPDGDWVRLFRRRRGISGPISAWRSKGGTVRHHRPMGLPEAYDRFRREREQEYRALDARLEGLTREEIFLGSYQVPDRESR